MSKKLFNTIVVLLLVVGQFLAALPTGKVNAAGTVNIPTGSTTALETVNPFKDQVGAKDVE